MGEVFEALELLGVAPAGEVFCPSPLACHLLLDGLPKRSRLVASPQLHLVLGVSPLDRVPEEGYQPGVGDGLRHPLGDERVKEVGRGGLAADGLSVVYALALWKVSLVPRAALGEIIVEEVQLLRG